jgi:Polysaccharide pyruvyl transferase.
MPSFYTPAVAKKYKLGIIPHWRHQQSVQCGEDVKFIDILRDSKGVEAFADDVCECEAILSSSLHGVITAYAYGIPARYIQIEGLPLEGSEGLKFADFFKSVRMPVQEPLLLKQNALDRRAEKVSPPDRGHENQPEALTGRIPLRTGGLRIFFFASATGFRIATFQPERNESPGG